MSQEIMLSHPSYGLLYKSISLRLSLKSHSGGNYFKEITRKTVHTNTDTGLHTSESAYCGRLNSGLPKDIHVLIPGICECYFIICMAKETLQMRSS